MDLGLPRSASNAFLTSVALWIISMFLPIAFSDLGQPIYGWRILIIGWFGPLDRMFAWYANPLAIGGVVLILRKRITAATAVVAIALVFAAQSFTWREIPSDQSAEIVDHLSFGFYVWLASLVVLLGTTRFISRNNAKLQP